MLFTSHTNTSDTIKALIRLQFVFSEILSDNESLHLSASNI